MVPARRLQPGDHLLAARGIRSSQRAGDRGRHGGEAGRLSLLPGNDASGVFALGRGGGFTQFGHG